MAGMTSLHAEFGVQPAPGMLGAQTPTQEECAILRTPGFPPLGNSQHRGLLGLPLPCGAGCAGSKEKHGPIHLPPRSSGERERERDRKEQKETKPTHPTIKRKQEGRE